MGLNVDMRSAVEVVESASKNPPRRKSGGWGEIKEISDIFREIEILFLIFFKQSDQTEYES